MTWEYWQLRIVLLWWCVNKESLESTRWIVRATMDDLPMLVAFQDGSFGPLCTMSLESTRRRLCRDRPNPAIFSFDGALTRKVMLEVSSSEVTGVERDVARCSSKDRLSCVGVVISVVVVFRLARVDFVMRLLFAASCRFLVFKILYSIKIRYALSRTLEKDSQTNPKTRIQNSVGMGTDGVEQSMWKLSRFIWDTFWVWLFFSWLRNNFISQLDDSPQILISSLWPA
jgi:hypothetical protein